MQDRHITTRHPRGQGSAGSKIGRSANVAFRPARIPDTGVRGVFGRLIVRLAWRRGQFPWGVVAGCTFFLIVSIWTRHGVLESLKTIMEKNLHAIIDADVTAYELWFEHERELVEVVALQDPLVGAVERLRHLGMRGADPGVALLGSPDLEIVRSTIASQLNGSEDDSTFLIIEPSGLAIAADETLEHRIGARLVDEQLFSRSTAETADVRP